MHIRLRMRVLIATICVVAALMVTKAMAEVSFRASVDKVETAFENKVTLDLEVTVSDPHVETTPLAPPSMVGFRIGGSVSSVSQEAGKIVRHYKYELFPSKSGPVQIPAFALEYSDSAGVDTLYSQPITVTVAQPVPKKEPGKTPWSILVITAVVLAAGVWWWIRRTQYAAAETAEPEWQAEYRSQLDGALELAERQNYREFFDKGSRLLVGLLEKVNDTTLKGKTVDDLCSWVRGQEMSDELKDMITGFLKNSESVKFTTGHVEPQAAEGRVSDLKKIVERLLA